MFKRFRKKKTINIPNEVKNKKTEIKLTRHQSINSLSRLSQMTLRIATIMGAHRFEGDYSGYGMQPTFSLKFKNVLTELSDIEITYEYINHPDVTIQFIALEVLATQNTDEVFDVLYKMIKEHGEEESICFPLGCVGKRVKLKNYVFTYLEKYLTENQKNELETTFGPFEKWW